MNIFGTDGIRSKFGVYPLSPENLADLGKAIGIWAINNFDYPSVLIADDSRISGSLMKSYLQSGLLQYDIDVFDGGTLPTPMIYNVVCKQLKFDLGIMITASHNPYYDNGIKIIDSVECKINAEDEQFISDIFVNKKFDKIDYQHLGSLKYYSKTPRKYLSDLKDYFKRNFLKSKKIILDCANGATSNFAPEIFQEFGAEPNVLSCQPMGININEDQEERINRLKKIVISEKAHIGFAFDGDGDRVIAINHNGEIKDGDDLLAVLLDHPFYRTTDTVVSTIVSNYGFEKYIESQNKKLLRTPVGDKFVVNELLTRNLTIGGEPSGHIILKDYLSSSDGIFAALRILETAIITNNWSLSKFEKTPQYTINIPVKMKKDLSNEPFSEIIENYSKQIDGKIVVRYSGTEPLLRIVVDSQSNETSKFIAQSLSEKLNYELQQ